MENLANHQAHVVSNCYNLIIIYKLITFCTVNSSSGSGEAIMQFGKSSLARFTLDFRFPLSPLQAFGIALASFAAEPFQMTETATEMTL